MTDGPASGLLKVQGSSRLAFGATTAALVTLASAGTAVLVQQAADTAATPTSLPPGALSLDPAPDATPVVVDHPAGQSPAPVLEPTEKALRDALAQRREPGRRTLTAPLVPVQTPVVDPVPVAGPVVPEPEPVLQPPAVVSSPEAKPGGKQPHGTDHGVSSPQSVESPKHAGRALAKGHAKHGRHAHAKGRHAR